MIYLDHAATTPLHPEVAAVMYDVMQKCYGNPSTTYTIGREARELLENARKQVADLICAQPEEIIFTSGGTESDFLALWGVVCSHKEQGSKKGRGSHIITSSIEHHAVLNNSANLAKYLDCTVTYLPVDGDGLIDPADVKQAIRSDTTLISIMHANNEIGTIEPIEEIASIAREEGVPFHIDAVQTVGHIPVDVNKLGVDLLSLSGHKFYGPKGVGALYVRQGTPFTSLLQGGGQERGYRSGTENLPGIVGLGKAAVIAQRDMEKEQQRLEKLRDALIKGIEEQIPGARLNGHRTKRLPHNVNFAFPNIEGESLLLGLDLQGIAVSSGSACSTGSEEPSHVLRALGGLPDQYLNGAIRMTLGRSNTEEDITTVIEALATLVKKLNQLFSS
ncbi:MAG: cysteine desulfurase family protein [Thermacetogeniaceae bacterium]|jgi:cysteine desulfurase|nr:cysteine desulfurase [Syntrophomonadaceae bacterium]